MTQCEAIKSDGTRCRGTALAGSKWCYPHDPEHREVLRRSGSKGGKLAGRGRHKSTPAAIDGILEELAEVAEQVRRGKLESRVGAVLAQLHNTRLRGFEVRMRAVEHEQWGAKLAEIEEHSQAWIDARSGSR